MASTRLLTAQFGQGGAMGQRFQQWRSEGGERMWLSALIEAMEEVSRPEFRLTCCDRAELEQVRNHLAQPAAPRLCGSSKFRLRN
jgi:hypothetical protein